MSKNTQGYKLDLAHQTLTMTATFAAAANVPNTDEYKIVRQFLRDFPNLKITYRTHETPKRYNNSNGTITKRNQFLGLTYKRMEKYMNALDDGQEYLAEYNKIRAAADAICASPYSVVAQWFMAQFPLYREKPLSYLTNTVPVLDYATFLEEVA